MIFYIEITTHTGDVRQTSKIDVGDRDWLPRPIFHTLLNDSLDHPYQVGALKHGDSYRVVGVESELVVELPK